MCPRRRSFRERAPEGLTIPHEVLERVHERHVSLLEEPVGLENGDSQQFGNLAEAEPLGSVALDGECLAGRLREVSAKGCLKLEFDPLRDRDDNVHPTTFPI